MWGGKSSKDGSKKPIPGKVCTSIVDGLKQIYFQKVGRHSTGAISRGDSLDRACFLHSCVCVCVCMCVCEREREGRREGSKACWASDWCVCVRACVCVWRLGGAEGSRCEIRGCI